MKAKIGDKLDDIHRQVVKSYYNVKAGKKPVLPKLRQKVSTAGLTEEQIIKQQVEEGFKRLNNLTKELNDKDDFVAGIKRVEKAVAAQSLENQKIFSTYLKDFEGFLEDKSTGGYFHPSIKKMNVDFRAMLEDPRGDTATFFHEFGHFVDNMSGGGKHGFRSHDETFHKILETEYNKLLLSNGRLKADIRRELFADVSSDGLQDTISGLSLNKNRVIYGHGNEYWESGRSPWTNVCCETYAHMFASLFNPKAAKYYEKYMPESYNYFKKEYVKEILEV